MVQASPSAWPVGLWCRAVTRSGWPVGGVAAAVVILADVVAGGFFELFRFRPGLFVDPERDNLLGFWLSDGPFTGSLVPVLIWAFPGWPGIIVGTFLVSTLEIIYSMAGIYFEQGWHVTYTLVGFPIYFDLMNLFHRTAERTGLSGGWIRTVVRYCWCLVTAGLLAASLRVPLLLDTYVTILLSGFAKSVPSCGSSLNTLRTIPASPS